MKFKNTVIKYKLFIKKNKKKFKKFKKHHRTSSDVIGRPKNSSDDRRLPLTSFTVVQRRRQTSDDVRRRPMTSDDV